MRCPFCGSLDSRVIDSRTARDGRAIRRRRECSNDACAQRFTTYEAIEEMLADVVKKDGRSEPFDRDKILRSLRIACKKRPIPIEALTGFVDQLEARLAVLPGRSIRSAEIGERVLAFLYELDAVAYVRYASVYRSFGSVGEFMDELRALEARAAEAGGESGS